MTTKIYIQSDNSVIFDGAYDSVSAAYLNSATVTFTLYRLAAVDGVMVDETQVLTSASNTFVAGDIGRSVVVVGAGEFGSDLRTTVASIISATSLQLNTLASVSVTSAQVRISMTNATGITMSYVAGSNGRYVGTIDDDVVLTNGASYWAEISFNGGSDKKDFRVLKVTAAYREEE